MTGQEDRTRFTRGVVDTLKEYFPIIKDFTLFSLMTGAALGCIVQMGNGWKWENAAGGAMGIGIGAAYFRHRKEQGAKSGVLMTGADVMVSGLAMGVSGIALTTGLYVWAGQAADKETIVIPALLSAAFSGVFAFRVSDCREDQKQIIKHNLMQAARLHVRRQREKRE